MEAEVIKHNEEEQIVGWIFDYACKFRVYPVIHEILLIFPDLSDLGLSNIRLALAAIYKIVTDEDEENFDLAIQLIKEVHTHAKIVSDSQYKQLISAFKVKNIEDLATLKKLSSDFVDGLERILPLTKMMLNPPCSGKGQTSVSVAMQIFWECLNDKQEGFSHDNLLELIKLLSHGDSVQKSSLPADELTDTDKSYSLLTGKLFEPVKKSVASEQICVISSSSDSGPLTIHSDPLTNSDPLSNSLQLSNSPSLTSSVPLTNSNPHMQEEYLHENSHQGKFPKTTESPLSEDNDDIFVQPSGNESSSPELFPYIKVEPQISELCVVKLHKDVKLSGSIRDPITNENFEIYR